MYGAGVTTTPCPAKSVAENLGVACRLEPHIPLTLYPTDGAVMRFIGEVEVARAVAEACAPMPAGKQTFDGVLINISDQFHVVGPFVGWCPTLLHAPGSGQAQTHIATQL